MLEKIKEVPFIDESKAVKVVSDGLSLHLERNDRVIWASEVVNKPNRDPEQEINCYVEADKFFVLLPDIQTLKQTTCLEVVLKNGAEYKLPFLDVSWETQEMPEQLTDSIYFKIEDLQLCTLKNLIKPELQCIWIDERGAVSCDFVSACINDRVKSSKGFLLPPDVQDLVSGTECKVEVTETNIYIKAEGFSIITSRPSESEDTWYNDLRDMVAAAEHFTETRPLEEALKRLEMFADYVSFDGEKVIAGSNYEPFLFEELGDKQYEIEKLKKLVGVAKHIGEKDTNIILKNNDSIFLLSAMEEA